MRDLPVHCKRDLPMYCKRVCTSIEKALHRGGGACILCVRKHITLRVKFIALCVRASQCASKFIALCVWVRASQYSSKSIAVEAKKCSALQP